MSCSLSRAVAALAVLSSPLVVAQNGAFYDVPALPGVYGLPGAVGGTDAGLGPLSPPTPPEGTASFGALTASPMHALRDVDGDCHLDALRARGGVAVWLGRGDGRFEPPSISDSQFDFFQPIDGLWGDVDGDGRLDVVFIVNTDIEVHLDQGDGTFDRRPVQTGAVVWATYTRTLGDYDGDGFVDIVGAPNGGGEIVVSTGRGDGTFTPAVTIADPPVAVSVVGVGHLDDDGRLDVVATLANGGTAGVIRAFLQAADGTLDQSATVPGLQVSVFYYGSDLAIRDMDGDGDGDVLASTPDLTTSIALAGFFRGDGAGGLDPTPVELPVVGANPVYADVDGDGLVDVVSRAVDPPDGVLVSLARPDGTLAPPVATRQRGDVFALGDVDGDGRVDALSETAVWFGRGDGGFATPASGVLEVDPIEADHVVVRDVDGDGRTDVVAAGTSFSLAIGASLVRGAVGGGFDAAELLLDGEPIDAVAAADIDGDGVTDLAAARDFGTQVYLFEGRADGSFAAPRILDVGSAGGHRGLAFAQIGGSALPELVLATGGSLVVRNNFGDFVFGPAIATPLPGTPVDPWLLVHDVDGDGRDDVFVAQPEVYLFRTVGAAPFAPPVAIGGPTSSLHLADVDDDGALDLLRTDAGDVITHLALGGGTFGPPDVLVDGPPGARSADVADVDADGLADLAVGRRDRVDLHLGIAPGRFAATPVDTYDRPGDVLAVRFVDDDADGRPDLLVVGDQHVAPSLSSHRDGTWRDLGFALPGATTPSLAGKGDLSPGSPLGVEVGGVGPATSSALVAGFAVASLPVKGGVLVPDPALVVPGLVASPVGEFALTTTWPPGVPADTTLVLQVWAPDAGAPVGWAASNALAGMASD